MNEAAEWRADETLAWTEHDGPGRPPAAPNRAVWLVLAGGLAVVFAGIVFSDTLCPEHRAWVQALGSIALIGTGTAVVGLVRGWSIAPVITLLTALCGVAIGLIDASHEPTRGRVIALSFALAVSLAGYLVMRQQMLRQWERDELDESSSVPAIDGALADAPSVTLDERHADDRSVSSDAR